MNKSMEIDKPIIEKCLTISTAHISEATANWLDGEGRFELTVIPKEEFGWFIYVDDFKERSMVVIPQDLHYLAGWAAANECVWLQIDRDAPQSMRLPVFNW